MNLKNILKISAIVGGIGIVSTPLIYQQQINKTLNIATKELKQNNILIQENQNNDTFVKLNREYILTIEDSTYLIKKLYPEIDPITLQELKSLLDGSKILVTLNFIKYPIYHKNAITLTLLSLNETLNNELKSEKTGLELLNFIKNKGLEAFIDIDNLKISQAKLKDINLKLTENQKFLNFIISNSSIKFNNNDTKVHISNIKLETKDNTSFLFNISNINYDIKYKNDFNYKSDLTIDSIKYKQQAQINQDVVALNNIYIKSNSNSILDRVNLLSDVKFDNFSITTQNSYFNNNLKIENFRFNFKLEKIDLNSLKNISNALQKNNYINMEKNLQTILNQGFSIKINPLSLKKASLNIDSQKLDISKISINFNAKVKKNKLDINNINNILNYADMDLNIITTKENINLLENFAPISTIYLQNIMIEKNNNIMINLSYKNNKLLSNGKQLF